MDMDSSASDRLIVAKQFFENYKNDHITFRSHDLLQLEAVTHAQQLQENEYIQTHRTNRFSISMTRTTFQLLISFLEDNHFVVLLRILNSYVNIDGTPNQSLGGYEAHGNSCLY
jgi:transcription initiation factor TFIID subunit 5